MQQLYPHIHFNGNTEEAFLFYKATLGGEINKLIRFHALNTNEFSFPEEESNKILHISLDLGENGKISGSDVPNMLGSVNENENRSKLAIRTSSKKEADDIFNGLSKGGNIEFPMGDSPWGTYFGAFRDKFGIEWMIEFDH